MSLSANIISTLLIFNQFVWSTFATRKGHSTCFPTAYRTRRTIEIIITIPVFWTFNAATLKPVFLYPIDQVLLIGVFSVVYYENLQTCGCLFFDLKGEKRKKKISIRSFNGTNIYRWSLQRKIEKKINRKW